MRNAYSSTSVAAQHMKQRYLYRDEVVSQWLGLEGTLKATRMPCLSPGGHGRSCTHPSPLLVCAVPAAQALGKARGAEGGSCPEPLTPAAMRDTWCEIKEKGYFSLDPFPKITVALKHYTSSVFGVGRGSREEQKPEVALLLLPPVTVKSLKQ